MGASKTKIRTIKLYKQAIYYEIDALTYKLTESRMQGADVKAKSAVASDSSESFDSSILSRMADYRDATLRKRLLFCLKDEDTDWFINAPDESDKYEYVFVVPDVFKDATLRVLGTKMHEYIVKGALLDWYIQTGTAENITALTNQVEELETEIVGLMRVPGALKKPLQPFGPQQ